jgi:hypothetical protein
MALLYNLKSGIVIDSTLLFVQNHFGYLDCFPSILEKSSIEILMQIAESM